MSDEAPFGRVLTAMVTPFDNAGSLDAAATGRLARFLTQPGWNDGLVLNGTTGESSTTTDEEKAEVIRLARVAVGPGTPLVAGVGSADTRHSIELAHAAERAGADGLMVVSPYYSRPTQAGIIDYFLAIADASALPIMVYNIPRRTGVDLTVDTIVRLAAHPHIVAVKDASGDLVAASRAMAQSGLSYYSGEDALNLPLAALGFVGVVSVVGHVAAPVIRDMLDAVDAGDMDVARDRHHQLLPLATGISRAPGAVSSKFALGLLQQPCGAVRSPYVPLTAEEQTLLRDDLASAGVPIG